MKKHKKTGRPENTNSGPSQQFVPASPKRAAGVVIVWIIVCAATAGFFRVRPSLGTDKKTQPPLVAGGGSSLVEAPAPPSAGSVLAPEQSTGCPAAEVAALKKEELELAERLMRDFPNSIDAGVLMGNVWERHGDAIEALKFWRKVLELDPRRPDVYKSMGWFAMQKGQYEQAIAYWRKALEVAPQMPDMHNSIALALMGLGKQKEAIEELEKDIQISPNSNFSYFMLGQIYLQQKEYEKAKKNYEKAIALLPSYTNAYYGLFTVCTRLNERDKAQEHMAVFRKLKAEDMKILKDRNDAFEDLVKMRKGAAETYMHAGKMYQDSGNLQRAEELLKKAATLDPKNSLCFMKLASLYQMSGRISDALEMHKKISQIEPENPTCYLNIGVFSAQLRRFTDAEEAFRKAIALAPESSIGYRELAQLYLKAERKFPQARELAEKAVALEAIAVNYFVLCWASDKNGDTANALKAIERAIHLEPGNLKYKQIYESIKNRN